jgi:Yip1 domain
VIRRLAGVVLHPRTTLAELERRPVWVDTWVSILIVYAGCGAALLTTDVGRQAVVDERVRVIETFGGRVGNAEYAAMQAAPPYWVYLTSGGRLPLLPIVTVSVALGCWAVARRDGAAATFTQALALAVHASVVPALGQIIATPVDYVLESLTSPFHLAAIVPFVEQGTAPARLFGAIDVFALWWMALIAIGLAALTKRSVRRYTVPLAAGYFGFAAILTGVITARGGF